MLPLNCGGQGEQTSPKKANILVCIQTVEIQLINPVNGKHTRIPVGIHANTLMPYLSNSLIGSPWQSHRRDCRDFTRNKINLSSLSTGLGGKRSRKLQTLEKRGRITQQ